MADLPEKGCPSCAKLRERIAELEKRYVGVAGNGDAYALTRVSYGLGDGRSAVYEPGAVIPPEHLAGLERGTHYDVR